MLVENVRKVFPASEGTQYDNVLNIVVVLFFRVKSDLTICI